MIQSLPHFISRGTGEILNIHGQAKKMAATLSLPVPKDQKFPQRFSKLPAAKQELSFGFIKGELLTGKLESVECEELPRYCSKVQLKTKVQKENS